MLRQSSLNQLKRINAEIKKQGGTIDRSSDIEKNLANNFFIQDPVDADIKGTRKIATYDQMFSIDIPDADTKVKMKNENIILPEWSGEDWEDEVYYQIEIIGEVDRSDAQGIAGAQEMINKTMTKAHNKGLSAEETANIILSGKSINEKNTNTTMKNLKSFDKMFENGPNDTPQEIMKNMKRIDNWFSENPTPTKGMSVGLVGKYIDTGKVKGLVQRIEGADVYVETFNEDKQSSVIKIKIKDAVKGYKPEKEKATADFAIEGPNNKSLGGEPKVGKSLAPKIDAKSTPAPDQKISNKINVEKSIKKLSDMAEPFDGSTASTKNSPVAPPIDKKGSETSDSKTIGNQIYKSKKIKKFDDNLAEPMKSGKPKKSENEPGATVDKTAAKAPDNSITKKNTSIKKFSDMKSDFEGPKTKK